MDIFYKQMIREVNLDLDRFLWKNEKFKAAQPDFVYRNIEKYSSSNQRTRLDASRRLRRRRKRPMSMTERDAATKVTFYNPGAEKKETKEEPTFISQLETEEEL